MNEWIDAKAFADKIFRSERVAQKAIAARIYKGMPLIVQQGKSERGGKPPYLVRWDTDLNQPATGEHHEKYTMSGIENSKKNNAAVQVTQSHTPSAPTALKFKQIAKTAEKNAQERDKRRMDAFLDKALGEQNHDITDKNKPLSRLLQPAEKVPVDNTVAETAANYAIQQTEASNYNSQRFEILDESESGIHRKSRKISEAQTKTLASQVLGIEAINQDFYPGEFDCQIDYVLRLIDKQCLSKVCRSTVLTAYFATVYIHESLRAEWQALMNNVQRTKFARKHELKGEIPNRLKAEGNPKALTGRKSTVPSQAVEWIIKKVHEWADDNAQVLTPTRQRSDRNLKWMLEEKLSIKLSLKQIATIIKNNNLRPLMQKPQGKEGKKITKDKGTYPRLPVNELWLMDGKVPAKLYIKTADRKRYTSITCIGVEDVGSRMLLGFREYYSETAESAVDLDKQVFIKNQFKKGTSDWPIVVTKRPDKGAGFMSQGAACAFALNKVYAEVNHFLINFKEAHAGTPEEKSHLESMWKAVDSTYLMMVRDYFEPLGKIEKTPLVANHKVGIEQSALYLDITLEELRAAGIAEKFRNYLNHSKDRKFREDNKDLRFVPIDRWNRYLSGTTPLPTELRKQYKWARFIEELDEQAPIEQPEPSTLFQLDEQALEMLNVFGYPKPDATVQPDMTIQYKVGYNVPRDLGFSVTRSTPVRVSEMLDGSGRLAIFTAKEKMSKTKHDFGAEFIGFATVKQIGGNAEKAKHVKVTKDQNMVAQVLKIKQESAYSLILKEIQPFLINFGTDSDERGLNGLVKMNLTPELARLLIEQLCVNTETGEILKAVFSNFYIEAMKRLQSVVIPITQKRNLR